MQKKFLLLLLLHTNSFFAAQECQDNHKASIDSQEIDKCVIPPLQEIVNQYLIGDSLKANPEFSKSLSLNYEGVEIAELTPNKELLVVVSKNIVSIIQTKDGKKIDSIACKQSIGTICIEISTDSKYIVIYNLDQLLIYNVDKRVWHEMVIDLHVFRNVAFSINNKLLIIQTTNLMHYCLRYFDLENQRKLYLQGAGIGYNDKYLLLCDNNFLKIYAIETRQEFIIDEQLPGNVAIRAQKILKNHAVIKIGTQAVVIDLENKQKIFSTDFEYYKSNDRLFIFKNAGEYKIFDTSTKQKIVLPNEIRNNIKNINIIDCGSFLHIKLMDDTSLLFSCKTLQNFVYHSRCFNTNFQYFAATMPDKKTIKVFDVHTDQELYSLELEDEGEIGDSEIHGKYLELLYKKKLIFYNLENRTIALSLQNNFFGYRSWFKKYIQQNFLLIRMGNHFLIYDLEQQVEIFRITDVKRITADDHYVYFMNQEGKIIIFDLSAKQVDNCNIIDTKIFHRLYDPNLNTHQNLLQINRDQTKLSLHKFDKSILHKLTPYQIQLISSINFEFEKNKTENNEDKEIYLTKELTELFKTLPEYVQRCLRSNYNLASDYDLSLPVDRFNLIQSSLENNSELV